MADKGLRRYIELVLDKTKLRRLKSDTQGALDDATDPKQAKRNAKEIESSFDRLKSAAKKLAVVMAGVWVVKRVADYARAVFDLGSAVLAVGSQFDTVFGKQLAATLRARTEDLRLMAGLTRRQAEELLAGAGSMAQGFGMAKSASADFSEAILELSADLASFNNVPTAEAAQLVQSALIGNTEAARSLKVSFTAMDVQNRALADTGKATAKELTQEEKAVAALAVMAERAGPMLGDLNRTQNDSDNVAKQLAGSYAQVKESLAAVLVESSSGQLGLTRLRDTFRDLDHWVRANAEKIGAWVGKTITAVTTVGRGFGMVVRGYKLIGSEAAVMAGQSRVAWEKVQQFAAKGTASVARVIAGMMTVLRTRTSGAVLRLLGLDDNVAAGASAMRSWADDVEANAKLGVDAAIAQLHRLHRAAAELRAGGAGTGIGGPPSTTTPTLPGGGGGGGGGGSPFSAGGAGSADLPEIPTTIPESLAGAAAAAAELQRIPLMLAGMIGEPLANATDQIGAWEVATLDAVHGVTRGFGNFFDALGEGFGGAEDTFASFADAAVGVGASVIAGLAEGQAQYHAAQAIGKLAEGIWPPNPAAIISAAKHAAAAVAFKGLESVLGRAAAGARSSGRGVGSINASGARDLGAGRDQVERTRPITNIYIDPFNYKNPVHQDAAGRAAMEYAERFGGDVVVRRGRRP